jgi:transposase
MDRAEAEAIYDSRRERCVGLVLRLAASVERLEEPIRRLEERARRDSRKFEAAVAGSSQDASAASDWGAREGQGAVGQGRRQAQRGWPGRAPRRRRRLEPEDQIDEIVCRYQGVCRGCGHDFTDDERRPGGRFGRHQIAELPPISVLVVEHRTHRLRCSCCGLAATAQLPDGIGCSAFGPRLRAAIVTLTARNRISHRGMAELALELFGARLSTGSVDAICQQASTALCDPHAALRAWVLAQDALHVDETGWRTAGDPRALWTMSTPNCSIFEIAEHCDRDQFDRLIGSYPGIIVSDRWPGYEHLDPTGGRCAGRICSAIFAATPKGSQSRRPSGSEGSSSAARC